MNRGLFFSAIRPMFGGKISPVQVQVIEAILDRASGLSAQHLAYVLATGFGEAKLTPVRENMVYTTAARIRKVWPSRPEAAQFTRQPRALANCVYNGRLGNKIGSDDGFSYRGGGLDQLTGRDNYRRIGIEAIPEKILQPEFAAWSLVHGLTTGRYRGHKLADFGDGAAFNATAARAIVNDDVKLNGAGYARHYRSFLAALSQAGWGTEPPVRPDVPPMAPARTSTPIKTQEGFWVWLFRALAEWKRK